MTALRRIWRGLGTLPGVSVAVYLPLLCWGAYDRARDCERRDQLPPRLERDGNGWRLPALACERPARRRGGA
jgi:hypothetical protein